MPSTLHEFLQPQVVLEVVSRIRRQRGRLSPWLGWQPDRFDPETVTLSGPNTISGPTRYATFRIDDFTRVVAKARAPGTGPATVAPNPIGEVQIKCARFHEKVVLYYEELGNLARIAGPNSQVDRGGQDYLTRQIAKLAIKFNNAVELLASGFLQDNLWLVQKGDNWIAVIGNPGGNAFQVQFQIPQGNKGQLNLLGAGNLITVPWNVVGAPIVGNMMAVKAAFAQLSGYPLQHAWVNSLLWYNIIVNTEVRNLAGSANTPFAEYEFKPEKGPDGLPTGEYVAVLRGDPTVEWHINDLVLVTGDTDIDPTYSTAPSTAQIIKTVPDNTAFFTPDPTPEWEKMYHGGEYVVENPGMPGALHEGYYFWREYGTQPSVIDLIGLLNCIPLLYVPKCICSATVNF